MVNRNRLAGLSWEHVRFHAPQDVWELRLSESITCEHNSTVICTAVTTPLLVLEYKLRSCEMFAA